MRKKKIATDAETIRRENLEMLDAILKDDKTPAAVKIQAIQAREKIRSEMVEKHQDGADGRLSIDDIRQAMRE